MKKLLIIPLLFVYFCVLSQESKDYLKHKDKHSFRNGYIINNDSIKVQGLIKEFIMQEHKKYLEVVFIPKDGKKVKFTATSIKGYGYSIYQFYSFGTAFYEVVSKSSKVELYKRVVNVSYNGFGPPGTAGANTYSKTSELFFIRRPYEPKLTEIKKKKFNEVFSNYFEDCGVLKNKILNKELTEKDIKKIVNEYSWCKS